MTKKIYTVEHCANRHMNYHTAAGLGFTKLVIFTRNENGTYDYDAYERNNKTGYCKDTFTGKRISQARWDAMYKSSIYAF